MNTIPAAAAVVEAAADAAVTERVAEVIEQSQARIEEAESIAQAVTDAAVQTELGRKVEAVEQGILACRNENSSLRQTIATLETRLAELATLLTTLQAPAPQPEVRILSTPEPSDSNPDPIPQVVIPDQLPASEAEDDRARTAAAQKPRRRVL